MTIARRGTPMSDELRNCPFCGGKADPEGWMSGGDEPRQGPACDDCGATADSAAAWNRRAPSAIAAMREHEAVGWQPIETAPKDGTRIFLVGGVYGGLPFVGVWDAHELCPDRPWLNAISFTRLYEHVPTHWRPLPAAPTVPPHG